MRPSTSSSTPGAFSVDHRNVQYWVSKFVRDPLEFDYIVCVDLYNNVAALILGGVSGDNRFTPIVYIEENCNLIVPGLYKTFEDIPEGYANLTSAIKSVAMAFRDMGMRQEAKSVITALMETYVAGERTPDIGDTLSPEESTNRVVSRI